MEKPKKKDKIIIGQPYLITCEDGLRSRLCAKVIYEGEERELYYEVEKEYEKYFCYERADAFLVGLLHTAMYNDADIVSEAPISERLLFQIKTYFIPIISDNLDDLHAISVEAPVISSSVESVNAVGTGVSGGVDSFYTLVKYSQASIGEAKLTHIMFNNIVSADNKEERIRTLHNQDVIDKRKIAEEMGLKFVELYSNLYMFYRFPGIFNHYFTMPYASAVLALQKLFGIYYFSSSYTLNSFSVDQKKIPSGAPFDLFTLDCVSIKNLKFYSAGMEVTRYNKMKEFVHNEVAQRHLQVCGISQSFGGGIVVEKLNCGHCIKCRRAIISLELLGALDKYKNLIDTTLYYKNKAKFIGYELAGDKGVFSSEIRQGLKEKNMMTLKVKFWCLIYSIRFSLAKNKTLRKIYLTIFNKGEK